MFPYKKFILSILLATLAFSQSTSAVDYVVLNNAGLSEGSVQFRNEIGFPYSMQTLDSSIYFIWRIFQQNSPAERKELQAVALIIENTYGIAYALNNGIHVNANYLGNYTGDVKREFTGVIYYEMTNILQWDGNGQTPSGLIEGIAGYVRLKANFFPSNGAQPGQGNRWDQSYDVTARFLDYCNSLRNRFVAELNEKMRTAYSATYFFDLLGKTVDQLWSDYKAKYS